MIVPPNPEILLSFNNSLLPIPVQLTIQSPLYLILVENRPVGQVRFDVEENFARIDYSIAKQFRGRKIGKTLLKEAISKYWSRNKIKLLGEVMPHNIASEKIFKSLGFRMKTEGDNKIFMKEANQPRKKNEKQKNINHCSSS